MWKIIAALVIMCTALGFTACGKTSVNAPINSEKEPAPTYTLSDESKALAESTIALIDNYLKGYETTETFDEKIRKISSNIGEDYSFENLIVFNEYCWLEDYFTSYDSKFLDDGVGISATPNERRTELEARKNDLQNLVNGLELTINTKNIDSQLFIYCESMLESLNEYKNGKIDATTIKTRFNSLYENCSSLKYDNIFENDVVNGNLLSITFSVGNIDTSVQKIDIDMYAFFSEFLDEFIH